jgi:hypothetical protein
MSDDPIKWHLFSLTQNSFFDVATGVAFPHGISLHEGVGVTKHKCARQSKRESCTN